MGLRTTAWPASHSNYAELGCLVAQRPTTSFVCASLMPGAREPRHLAKALFLKVGPCRPLGQWWTGRSGERGDVTSTRPHACGEAMGALSGRECEPHASLGRRKYRGGNVKELFCRLKPIQQCNMYRFPEPQMCGREAMEEEQAARRRPAPHAAHEFCKGGMQCTDALRSSGLL